MLRRIANLFQKPPKQNNALSAIRKKVVVQAIIAVQTIVITVALIFGMSAAWYTNVLQTGGLQFEASAWGFSGSVTVAEESIQASPGENGIIGLTVDNTGTAMTDVSVYVSKVQMDVPMQQRLFFYVDDLQTRNGELMQRIYVNTKDGYTYTMKGNSQLVLTSERYNDVPLQWQWVYDMLGYYFLGTVTVTEQEITVQTVNETTGEVTATKEKKAVYTPDAEDYLRPVEYDLDSATFDESGMLETVDGSTTVEQFLKALEKTDGYEGQITAAENMPGFYKVNVDENGYGIWIYLANWAEIQQATVYDSALGQAAADALADDDENTNPATYLARLTVMGQATEWEYTQVTTAEQLSAALESGGNIQLQGDVTLTEAITVNSAVNTVLDLNGKTLNGPSDTPLLNLTDAADVTVLNGSIVANSGSKDMISVTGSSLTLDGVTLSGTGDDAIDISDEKGTTNSVVRVLNSNVTADGCAVYLRGNADVAAGNTRVIIDSSTLTSGYMTIMGNGTAAYWGTDIQVYNSTLVGKYTAVYQPQSDSIISLSECTLKAETGIVIKGGELEMTNCLVSGTAGGNEPKLEGSGFSETGDALFIDCSYQRPIKVTVSGSNTKLTSEKAMALRVFVPEDTDKVDYKDYSSVMVTGGTFTGKTPSNVGLYVPEGYVYDDATGVVTEGGDADGQ